MGDMIDRDDAIKVARSLFRLQTSGLYGAAGVNSYGLLTEIAEQAIRALPAAVPGVKPLVWEDSSARHRIVIAAERARVAKLVEAGKRVLEPLDEPCRRDHHGYCQAHFIEADCSVAALRAAITEAGK